MLQYFNTSWAEITRRVPELAEAGYTSLWLPPPTKGSGGLSVGYDLWDPFDIGGREQRGTFSTRYGTEAELHRLIETAHRFGIRVYFDNIMNHRSFDVPGYNDFAPPDLYPGMRPEDFHIRRTEDGYYRKWDNVREWWSEWQVQNLGLADLVDIATEPGTTNRNFGAWEGATTEKIKFLRHPNNPEYYCYDANGTYVGFGKNNGLTSEYLLLHEAYYSEYVENYLNRAVRWLLDRTKADGLRLDAVKHMPADFYGATYGDDRDRSNYGYLGQAQEQFNLTRGFSDWGNHRDTVFDTELPRDDAMMFGEHLGEPPAVGGYIDSGMRLLDNNLRHHLNSQLGNPWGTLEGLDSSGGHGFSPGASVMHAQSHDSDYAARRELQHALYLTRGGIGIIYSDGNHKAGLLKGSGGAFPRHANTNFLGQWGDTRIPNLLYFHEHFARGDQVGRWSDEDVVIYERVDKRENPGMSDAAGTVGLVMINDNYANGQARGFATGFPAVGGTDNDAYLYNYSSYGGGFYKYASQLNQVVIPAGGYFLFSWRSPESSDLWELAGGHPLSILQDGEEVGTVSVKRTDGPDGDPGFNPYGVPDDDPTDFSYSWSIPRVTNGANLKFVVQADGSAENVLLKLDGGMDLNGNGWRDNAPALSSDLYLGYEQMNFVGRQGPEKFAARDTSRNMIGSAGAETYWWHADNGSFFTVNGGSGADSFPNETAHWVYHDPEQNNDQSQKQFKVTDNSATIWVKVGYRLEVNQVRLYHVTDDSNPEGAGGRGLGTTQVTSFVFSHADGQEPTVDWWKVTVPLPESGIFKYKIGVYRNESNGLSLASVFPKNEPSVALKKKMLTTFEIDGFNADAIEYRPHNDWGQKVTGLKEGFHYLKGRAFLSRLGQAAIYNTFTRTFYYDTKRPEGETSFPGGDGEELFGSEYGFVVRSDPSVTEVLYHVDDNDPTNDDSQTGALNGNGATGDGNSSSWAPAMEITSRQDLGSDYPKEWRFSYRNVPPGGGEATVRIALKEVSSSNNLDQPEEEGHFRVLTRTVKTSGPNHRLFATWPQRDGEKVGQDYVMKTYLSSALVDGKSDAEIIANLSISIDGSIGQEAPYPSAVAQDVSSAWVEREVAPGLTALAYKLPILRNPEGAPDDFSQTIIVDYKDEGAGVDLRTVRTVTTDFVDHGLVNPILKVNEVNADYTSTHLFVDEVKGNEEALEIVLEAPHVTMAEVYTNLNNRDLATNDSNGDGIEDGIQAPDRDSVSQANNNGYYQVHAMTFDASRGEAGAWICQLKAVKTGAYRLTARFKLEDDADVWHWYTNDGRRDHAVVVTPMTVRSAIMYELNPLSVDAAGDSFVTRSTFEDLHDGNRWNLDYLKGMGANWLWLQPIHPRGEDGRENVNGQPYDPGSPYAVKNFFEIMPQLSNANTRTDAMQAFQDFVTAADAKGVSVMVDAPFNHVAWDVELDEKGVEIFGTGTAESEIRATLPGFFSREGDYGLPARDENEIATAPDRDDFGKWNDVKDVYFGNYSALVRGNDPAERNPHQNEEDIFDYAGSGWNEQTRNNWKYFASYAPYWLEKTGLPAGQSVAVQAQTGIDGLRADFGQGLPPQLWEYVINVARARKWSFVFMSESLDGGAV
ncbi:MAG: alpha-amylase family glycosyl hydrolase, partial [Opitutales bacterium]